MYSNGVMNSGEGLDREGQSQCVSECSLDNALADSGF